MAQLKFKDLDVWKVSMDLVVKVYEITRGFPKVSSWTGITTAESCSLHTPRISLEIQERNKRKTFAHFLDQARGSLFEVISRQRFRDH